jgi:hypothetical protein
MTFDLNSCGIYHKIHVIRILQEGFSNEKPAAILSFILAAINLTSANATVANQLDMKLSSSSPGLTSAAMPPEDMPLKVKETIWMI